MLNDLTTRRLWPSVLASMLFRKLVFTALGLALPTPLHSRQAARG